MNNLSPIVSNKKNRSRKGQQNFIGFFLIGIVVAFIFAIVALPVGEVSDRVYDAMKDNEQISESNTTVEQINQVQGLTTSTFDQVIFYVLLAVILGGLFIAMFSNYSPALVAIFVIAIVLLVIVAGLIANAYDDVQEEEFLENKSKEFTLSNTVMGKNLPIVILVMGAISVIILLSKKGTGVSPA